LFGFDFFCFHGCSGGKSSARVNVHEQQQVSLFASLIGRELSDFKIENGFGNIQNGDRDMFKFFAIDLVSQIRYVSRRGYGNSLKIFNGPSYADDTGNSIIYPGLNFRLWKQNELFNYSCGEILGIFEIDKKRIIVNIFMSRDVGFGSVQRRKNFWGTFEMVGKCAHPIDNREYFPQDQLILNSGIIYKSIVNDIEKIDAENIQTISAALSIALIHIAIMVSGRELSEAAKAIWDSNQFNDDKPVLRRINEITRDQFTQLNPRFVLLSIEDILD